ncbi:MAG: ABC transporter substrate-binding protein, partial [Candidatus Paceibacterota bacterium]
SFQLGLELGMKSIPSNTKFEYQLITEDDQLNPAKVASAVQKLINQDAAHSIISTWSYGGNVVAPLLKEKSIPHLAVAWDPNILTYGNNNFLNLLSPKQFLPDFFRVFNSKGYKKVALIYFAEAGSVYCGKLFKDLAAAEGIEVVMEEELTADTDLKTIALKFKNSNPEIIFANLVGSQLEVFIKNLKAIDFKNPITTMTGFDLMSDLNVAEGFWFISDSSPKSLILDPKESSYGLGNFYDYIKIIVQAHESWEGAGVPSGEWVSNYLNQTATFPSAFGTVRFLERTAVYDSRYYQIINGQKVESTLEELISTKIN